MHYPNLATQLENAIPGVTPATPLWGQRVVGGVPTARVPREGELGVKAFLQIAAFVLIAFKPQPECQKILLELQKSLSISTYLGS